MISLKVDLSQRNQISLKMNRWVTYQFDTYSCVVNDVNEPTFVLSPSSR